MSDLPRPNRDRRVGCVAGVAGVRSRLASPPGIEPCDLRRSQVFGKWVAGHGCVRTVSIVNISTSSAALANLATGRLQAEVATTVLGKALDNEVAAATSLIEALSVSEPAGLTFSAAGLSSGRSRTFIADL